MEYQTLQIAKESYTIGLVNDTPLLADYYKVRKATLRSPWGRDWDNPTDDLEQVAFHLAVWQNKEVLAVARLHLEELNFQQKGVVRYVGVLFKARGKGLGFSLMKSIESLAQELKCTQLTLASRDNALKMYLKLGYKVQSFGVHRWEQIPHWNCIKFIDKIET